VALDHAVPDVLARCLGPAVDELKARQSVFLGTGPVPARSAVETLMRMGFNNASEQVLLSKSIGKP
jgi:hypothetical protein